MKCSDEYDDECFPIGAIQSQSLKTVSNTNGIETHTRKYGNLEEIDQHSHCNSNNNRRDSKIQNNNDESDHKETVILEPFIHQVGGHNVFLSYNSKLLCKVFNADEYLFYKYMSTSLKDYIPKFNGLANVQRCVDDNGDIYYIGSSINEGDIDPKLISQREIRCEQDRWDANCIKRTESIERVINQKRCHPWYIEARKRFDIKWEKYKYSEKIFMMLENVTTNYDRPCVLDVKIGFRAHGDHTETQKIERKILRCRTTTTSLCGIRLCGLQTYHVKTDSYTFLNKYNGRSLDMEQLRQKLGDYFYDGENYRYELIEPFVRRLESLIETLNQLSSLRLFATSVLLVYEGNISHEQLKNLSSNQIEQYIDLRLIDFAQSSFIKPDIVQSLDSGCDKIAYSEHIGPDENFVLGLSNLVNIFGNLCNR